MTFARAQQKGPPLLRLTAFGLSARVKAEATARRKGLGQPFFLPVFKKGQRHDCNPSNGA